jgi:hypothetical protein
MWKRELCVLSYPFEVSKFSTAGYHDLCYEYCCYITICMLFCNFIDDTVGERKLCFEEIFVEKNSSKRNLCKKEICAIN